MASVGQVWRFVQLGGEKSGGAQLGDGKERAGGGAKVLELHGWSAPFGRPRQGAVVRTPIRTRTERTYYPGSSVPTRHIFGHKYEDWELKGRFRDRELGAGGALEKVEEVKRFVKDAKLVQVSWGNMLTFTGFIDEFDPGYEAEREIEWTLRLSIDTDDTDVDPLVIPHKPPQDSTAAIWEAQNHIVREIKKVKMPTDVLDALDTFVSSFTGAVGQLRSAAEKIQNFKDSTFGQINRAVSAVSQMRTAGLALRETFVTIPLDVNAVRSKATDIIKLASAKATVEEQMLIALGEGANIERAATLAVAGRARATYVASAGDTWESISNSFYGTPSRANDIRESNAMRPGQNPVPGTEYLVPK